MQLKYNYMHLKCQRNIKGYSFILFYFSYTCIFLEESFIFQMVVCLLKSDRFNFAQPHFTFAVVWFPSVTCANPWTNRVMRWPTSGRILLAFLLVLPCSPSSSPSFSPSSSQTQYLTLPKSPSPINLPVHYTPAISASPLRQVQPTAYCAKIATRLSSAVTFAAICAAFCAISEI